MKKIIQVVCLALAMLLAMAPMLDVDAYAAGYSISGLISTSGSGSDTILVELLSGGTVVTQVSAEAQQVTYQFKGIEPGTYTLRVSKPGHKTYTGTITVSNANVVRDVTLTPTSAQSYTISGYITSYGSNTDSITVKLLRGSTLVKSLSLAGNSIGYSFTGIDPGTYTLEVSKAGHSTATASVTVSNTSVTKDITLSPTSTATYTISGTISCHGNPTATIYLELYNGTTLIKSMTFTGESVKYSISGLPSGTYRLLVRKAGFNDYESKVVVNGANTSKNVPMFKIAGGVTVSGNISGMSNSAGVSIYLYEQGKTLPSYEALRNGNGSFSMDNVAAGQYTIKAASPGYEDYTATLSVSGNTTHNIKMKAAGHSCTPGSWKSDGANHWKTCTSCGKEIAGSKESHKGGAATCQTKAQCQVCNGLYGELAAHDWNSQWDHSTAEGHGHLCMTPGCQEVSPIQEHTPNIPAPTGSEDQICTLCGYIMKSAAGSSDPTEPSDPGDPGNPGSPADPTEPSQPSVDGASGGGEKPQGMEWWVILLIVVAAAGLGMAVTLMVVKKKK